MSVVPFHADALVVRATPYGESDLVVQLLVRGRGRLGAFARGARKPNRRYGGALEPFCLIDVELSERRGGELLDLRGAEVVDAHHALRTDLSRLAHAGYAVEVARELLREREANDALFELVQSFLSELARAGAKSVLLRAFELAVLGAAGLAPVLEACARCAAELAGRDARFDVVLGGASCGACAGPFALPLDPVAHRLLALLRAAPLSHAAGVDETGLPLEPVRRVLRAFLDHHVHHELRSRAFLRDVGAPQ